uniref:Ion_trans domain-containing protein n=1 Tax=Meloidogyne hapla TaxID=6305 RepID=A0A1I8B4E0_MELHA
MDDIRDQPGLCSRFFNSLGVGFYIVTYALFIYYLNLFLAFLTPKIDPAMEFDEVLTCLTMKRQIMHMIRYRYIPFTTGKPRPKGKEDSGKVVIG